MKLRITSIDFEGPLDADFVAKILAGAIDCQSVLANEHEPQERFQPAQIGVLEQVRDVQDAEAIDPPGERPTVRRGRKPKVTEKPQGVQADEESLTGAAVETLEALKKFGPTGPGRLAGMVGLSSGTVNQRLIALERKGLAKKSDRGVYEAVGS